MIDGTAERSMPPISIGAGPLFWSWLRSGGLAFGGGAVALEAIRREFVDRKGWMTEHEFSRFWSLCQVAPGINLFGMTVLIGRQLGGGIGILASMLGMLLPSAGITLVLAVGFAALRNHPSIEAAMRGVVPVTAGLSLASIYRTGRPLVRQGWKRGRELRIAAIALPFLGVVGLLAGLPPVALLIAGPALGALVWWRAAR